jgi:hypothetical protein
VHTTPQLSNKLGQGSSRHNTDTGITAWRGFISRIHVVRPDRPCRWIVITPLKDPPRVPNQSLSILTSLLLAFPRQFVLQWQFDKDIATARWSQHPKHVSITERWNWTTPVSHKHPSIICRITADYPMAQIPFFLIMLPSEALDWIQSLWCLWLGRRMRRFWSDLAQTVHPQKLHSVWQIPLLTVACSTCCKDLGTFNCPSKKHGL